MIEVRNLSKDYGAYKAIHELNFSMQKGEVVGFLGPNGAGKTTTMKIITGYMAPTSGSVKVAGFDVFEDPIEVKKRIGYLPETPPLYLDMTVREYLRFVAALKGVPSASITANVERALEKTDLGNVQKRVIQNLSKGFKQRVGIAQAIVSDPEILILDEPTVGLDPRQMLEIRSLIKELAGQHTILISTHILPEVQAMCKRIIIINRGRIVAEDTLEGISNRMSGSLKVHLRVRKAVGDLIPGLQGMQGVRSAVSGDRAGTITLETDGSDDVVEGVASMVVQKGCGLLELRSESMNLEDVFIRLTSSEEAQQGVLA